MKPIKILVLTALVALMAMAFVGITSSMAESTALCATDEDPCEEENQITHVHEGTLFGAKAKLLSSILNVECDVLFLGDTFRWWIEYEGIILFESVGLEETASLNILGNFTYSNCNNGCTITEENGPTEIEVVREGSELASARRGLWPGLVHLICGASINCRYVGSGLIGHGLGPLTSKESNGSVTLSEQTVTKESGTLCPSQTKLDITTTPLEATYISG